MDSFEDFSSKYTDDDLGLTLSFFMARSKGQVCVWAFIWEEFMDFVQVLVHKLMSSVKKVSPKTVFIALEAKIIL